MPLTRKSKIWITILAIPAGLIVLALIFATFYFTSERLKAVVIPQIEGSTHRTVSVKDISLSIFPLGVSVGGLSISNPPNKGFESSEFIALDHLALNVKILPLITGKIEMGRIRLDHPVINLEVTPDGLKNFSGNATEAEAKKQGSLKEERGSAGAFLLSDLEIRNGELLYTDRKFDSRMAVSGLNGKLSAETKPAENALHVTENVSVDSFSYGSLRWWYLSGQPVTSTGSIVYEIGNDILKFDNLTAKVRELPLSIAGSIGKLSEKSNDMDLHISSPGIQMTQFLSILPPEMLKKTSGLEGSGEIALSLAVTGPSSETINPAVSASFTVSNGSIHYASLPKSITNVNLSGAFEKPSVPLGAKGIGSFRLHKFSANFGSNSIDGRLQMTNLDDPLLSAALNGSMNLDEVKEFYPLEPGTELHGRMKSAISIDGKPKLPQTLKANGTIDLQGVTIKSAASKAPISNLNGTVEFNNQVVQSKQLAMNIGESDLNLSFALKNYLGMVMEDAAKSAGTPTATLTLKSKQLRTADLMSDNAPPAGAPKTGSASAKKPAGGGLVPGIDVNADVSIDKLVTDKFTFNNAKGTAAISGGKVNLKNFTVNAFQGTIKSQGTLDLHDQAKKPFDLDLSIVNVESGELLPKFTSFGKYLAGKLNLNTKLKGDLNDTLGLNTQSLLGNGDVHILEGKLLGLPLMQKVAQFTNLESMKQVNFKDWTNAFSIQDGRFNVKGLKVDAGTTKFLVDGSQGLDGSLNYNLNVRLPGDVSDRLKLNGVGDQVLQFLKDKDGNFNLNFLVGGTASDPVLKLNTEAQANAAKQKVEEDLKKKAQEGLMKLFKKP